MRGGDVMTDDEIEAVLDKMRLDQITAAEARRELQSARKAGRITDAKRYREALSEVYGHIPIWLEEPTEVEAQ